MKVLVNRQLSSGQYTVRFTISDFTPEELAKMNSFGIPIIQLLQVGQGVRRVSGYPINQVNPSIVAIFGTEEEANKYQESVMTQIKQAMTSLRERKDDFTSTEEVNI